MGAALNGIGYGPDDIARLADEPAKRSRRGPFQRDHARVVHSAALRRLAAKTQVVGPGSDDFVRNRLTHTLEVAQIGRELARALGSDPDLVETACLAHDLGHPPFGHNGERALNDVAAEAGGFEGNAQTLRILARLEPKTLHTGGRSAGLNLTRASLDAATKYPWPREDAPTPVGAHADGSPRQIRKFGVYADDAEVFGWLRSGAPAGRTCLEAQAMDLADDIAYSVHDVEDAVAAGRMDLTVLDDAAERSAVVAAVVDWYLPDASDGALEAAITRLRATPAWPATPYDGTRSAQAALKNLTSELIGRFCSEVEDQTLAAHGGGPLTRYAADLEVPAHTREEIAVLKGLAAHYVMRTGDRVAELQEQRAMVAELVTALDKAGPQSLEPVFRADFDLAPDDAARLRVIVDQVASLTDASALAWHRHLVEGWTEEGT
ncbi:MAG TPA: deoxyguanosinetriphosphate triphosphohydrolase [Nocardioidaceae bacterium]|nr:deoxyguanosinetriphosphate triphosphohydrolase [Nocardioidaceae bacterium]